MDLLQFEKEYWNKGIKYIAGIDEAGRGPLAGPVVAACVIFEKDCIIEGVKDSKKLSEKKRLLLYKKIYQKALSVEIGIVNNEEIDNINILQATFLAMNKTLGRLSIKPEIVFVDGPKSNIKLYPTKHIINGDNLSQSIAAASIIAKVRRDKMMLEFDKVFPEYGFAKHKGYGTKFHIEMIQSIKSSALHRKSFNIVKNNMPSTRFIMDLNKGFERIGNQIIAMKYIYQGYSIIDQSISFDPIDDVLDYYLYNKYLNRYIFIKIISIVNESKLSLGNCKIKNIDNYIGCIDKYIIENNCNKTYHFNVISIEFLKSKKPIIKTINEKIIN
tara:strand:- start:409 stop:1395 length:987 start_codon:yes stop_codon:yes gene_type:complete